MVRSYRYAHIFVTEVCFFIFLKKTLAYSIVIITLGKRAGYVILCFFIFDLPLWKKTFNLWKWECFLLRLGSERRIIHIAFAFTYHDIAFTLYPAYYTRVSSLAFVSKKLETTCAKGYQYPLLKKHSSFLFFPDSPLIHFLIFEIK